MGSETPDQVTRRRWVTLAEVVAVAGVLIAAATLYLGWSDRRDAAAAKQAEQASAVKTSTRVTLTATVENDGARLALEDPKRPVATVTVVFPKTLGIAVETDVTPPTIAADWLAERMLQLTDGGPDARRGKIPVLITSRWADDEDTPLSDTAIYDLSWHTEGRTLRGRAFKLDGLLLRERGGDQRRLDALWKAP